MMFDELMKFIREDMKMSHIYQPVMLRVLLDRGGGAATEEIAAALLAEDRSQREYYGEIVKNMVGRVLRGRGIVERDDSDWRLIGFDVLDTDQVVALRDACDEKLAAYLAKRGDSIWNHRRRSHGYISGTVRYEVLKAAQFRCELCGASAEDRALEADHIIPRSLGGTDDRSNLQALCYRCNAMKGDRDATDFRKVRESYSHREPGCPFCDLEPARVIAENELAVALEDAFPVTRLHALVVPRRHVNDLFDLGIPEVRACHGLLSEVRQQILAQDPTVLAFNVGVNTGAEAGQTVPHCHYHLIPRRIGDVPNPRGGIRNVIPGMGDY